MKNWKTTMSGICLIIGGIAIGASGLLRGENNMTEAGAMIMSGIGLLAASDGSL